MHITVKITVEHQNDGQADDQDNDNTGCEHLLAAVQRSQEIAHPCIRHQIRINRLYVFGQHIIVVLAGMVIEFQNVLRIGGNRRPRFFLDPAVYRLAANDKAVIHQ